MVSTFVKLWCLWRVYRGASTAASAVCVAAPYIAATVAGVGAARLVLPSVVRAGPSIARAVLPSPRWARLPTSPAPTW